MGSVANGQSQKMNSGEKVFDSGGRIDLHH